MSQICSIIGAVYDRLVISIEFLRNCCVKNYIRDENIRSSLVAIKGELTRFDLAA